MQEVYVKIWWTDIGNHARQIVEQHDTFGYGAHHNRHKKYHTLTQKANSIIGKHLLEYGLHKQQHTHQLYYSPSGKPYLSNDLYVSFSHSNQISVCAISNTDIGIDIQNKQEWIKGSEGFFMEKSEITNAVVSDPLSLWTQKEASYKLLCSTTHRPLMRQISINSPIEGIYQNQKIKLHELFIDKQYLSFIAALDSIKNIKISFIPTQQLLNFIKP